MFTARQYRTTSLEYADRVKAARSPSETTEFQSLERTYKSLAENAECMENDADQPISPSSEILNDRNAFTAEEEQVFACLGTVVMMRWGTLPTKIQRDLLDCTTTIWGVEQASRIKRDIGRLLHEHENGGHRHAAAFAVASRNER